MAKTKINRQSINIFMKKVTDFSNEIIRKIKSPKFIKYTTIIATILIFLITYGIIQYFIIFPSRGYFHSDNTDTLYWAQAMFDAKWIYNLDFNYAAFLPFGGSLLMLPFIPIFGVSMTTHIIGMSLFFILLVFAVIWLLRSMNFSYLWASIIVFALMFGIAGSDKIREIIYGHVIYYSLGFLFFVLGLNFIFRLEKKIPILMENKKKTKTIIISILVVIFFALATMNGLSVMTLFTVPVLGGYFLERFFRKEKFFSKNNNIFFIVFGLVVVGALFGFMFNAILSNIVYQGYADAYSAYDNPADWMDNLNKFINQWYTLFGVNITQGDSLNSINSFKNIIRIITGFLILLFPLLLLLKYNKIKFYRVRVLVIAHFISVVLLMIGYIFGLLSAANWRLTPLLASSLLVSLIYLKKMFENIDSRKVAFIFLIPFLLNGLIVANDIREMPYNYNLEFGQNDAYIISRNLQEHGLEYGYATFWHAQAPTVISGSKVKIRSITYDLNKYLYQSEDSWYEDQPDINQYFVLLTNSEYMTAVGKDWYTLDHTEYTFSGYQNYHVLIFNENIF